VLHISGCSQTPLLICSTSSSGLKENVYPMIPAGATYKEIILSGWDLKKTSSSKTAGFQYLRFVSRPCSFGPAS